MTGFRKRKQEREKGRKEKREKMEKIAKRESRRGKRERQKEALKEVIEFENFIQQKHEAKNESEQKYSSQVVACITEL